MKRPRWVRWDAGMIGIDTDGRAFFIESPQAGTERLIRLPDPPPSDASDDPEPPIVPEQGPGTTGEA